MKTITYTFADGHKQEIEITDEIAGRIAKLLCGYMFTNYAVDDVKDDKND